MFWVPTVPSTVLRPGEMSQLHRVSGIVGIFVQFFFFIPASFSEEYQSLNESFLLNMLAFPFMIYYQNSITKAYNFKEEAFSSLSSRVSSCLWLFASNWEAYAENESQEILFSFTSVLSESNRIRDFQATRQKRHPLSVLVRNFLKIWLRAYDISGMTDLFSPPPPPPCFD